MDPNAALAALIDAALHGDAETLRQAADDLATWLEQGGFAPNHRVLALAASTGFPRSDTRRSAAISAPVCA